MNKIYSTLLVALAGLFLLSGCQKEEQHLAKAILASAHYLEFEAENPVPQMITVYADAEWMADTPEWVTVDPAQGSGTMDVTIAVTPNMAGGEMDNPRKEDLVFKGANLASWAKVEIRQKGDKYRGVTEISVADAVKAADETMLIIPDGQVMAKASDGFILSDGTGNIFIGTDQEAAIGDHLKVMGMKSTVSKLAAIMNPDRIIAGENAEVTYPEAQDISSEIDTYDAESRVFISVEGEFDGSVISVEGQKFGVHPLNPDAALKLDELKGHILHLSGYFAGRAEPVINMTVAKVEDKGRLKTVWFQEDFGWLKKYIDEWNANNSTKISDSVKDQISSAGGSPNLFSKFEGFAAEMTAKGYDDYTGLTDGIYLQDSYLKFSKGSLPNGIKLTKPFPDDFNAETVTIEFDWCAHGGGSGKIDGTQVVVEIDGEGQFVSNGAKVSDAVASKQKEGEYFWQHVSVQATGLDASSKIYFRPLHVTEKAGEYKYQRWHIDNIMIYSE